MNLYNVLINERDKDYPHSGFIEKFLYVYWTNGTDGFHNEGIHVLIEKLSLKTSITIRRQIDDKSTNKHFHDLGNRFATENGEKMEIGMMINKKNRTETK